MEEGESWDVVEEKGKRWPLFHSSNQHPAPKNGRRYCGTVHTVLYGHLATWAVRYLQALPGTGRTHQSAQSIMYTVAGHPATGRFNVASSKGPPLVNIAVG